ncbi:MAG TPA: hypothetical protein VFS00_03455 [Polyangiaceae bacterium]|nr:hypothetical protein [Polyangiaceae bacterium]
MPVVGFGLCLSASARAKGPEWFDPAPAKPAAAEGPGERSNEAPGEGAAEAKPPREAEKAPPPAPCPPPAPPAPPVRVKQAAEPKPEIVKYGWQTMASDVTAVALLGIGSATENDGVGSTVASAAGLGFYLLGAPLVHAAHGQIGKGFGSFGLRLGAPIGGALTGLAIASTLCPGEQPGENRAHLCPIAYSMLGGFLGTVTAVLVDATVLAKKEVRARPSVSFAPSVIPSRNGASFGLAGAF